MVPAITYPSEGREFYDDGYEEEEMVLNDRIVFHPDRFYGRKQELQTLKDIYYSELCENQDVPPPVVIVDGRSGTGKSTLVRRFISELKKEALGGKVKPHFSMHGKFDELQNADPYSAILEALSGFCRDLLKESEQDSNYLLQIRKAINDSFGAERSSLSAVIPGLRDILGDIEEESEIEAVKRSSVISSSSDASTGNSWNRLRYLFAKFFHTICLEECPVIMFLDDLQWADEASLGLLDSLVQDKSLKNFMFIGAVRGNEVDRQCTKLSKFLRGAEIPSRIPTRIELLNLSIDELGEFVADTLHLGADETRPLTEIIYGKTRGNIFFSMQTLEELQRRNVVYFSMITFRWEWNLVGIEFENALSNTVVEAVASKIQSLPEKLQRALIISAYTRSSIDIDTLKALMVSDGYTIEYRELVGLLDMAVLEGLLLNTVGSGVYKFSHDRIQQAAYWMVPSGQERDRLRIMIGKNLVSLSSQQEGRDWMLFVAADHLNSCTGHGQNDLSLSELNLECGEKASKLAAFVPASLYLRLALKYLRKTDKDPWKSHYNFCLRVYREITNIELCLGNFESGNELGRQVIDNAATLEDKLPTYLVLAVAKGRQHRHEESFVLCQEALLRLHAIPRRMHVVHLFRDVRIVRRLLKKNSDYDILMLPLCQDPAKATIMDFFTEYSLRSFHCGNFVEFLYAIVRKLRITFKHGLARGSAHAFASFGLYFLGPGKNYEGALRMARLAREIMTRMERFSRPTNALTYLIIANYIEAWSFPREHVMETLQQAHHMGMASGNIEMGFQNWASCNIFALTSGYPLDAIERTGAELMEQLRLYHVDSVLAMMVETQLLVACLIGRKEIDWEELQPTDFSHERSETYRNLFGYLVRLELGVYFGNLEFAIKISALIQPFIKRDGSYVGVSKEHFFSALAFAGLARETGTRKYQVKAVKYLKKLRYLCRTRGLNIHHKCLLVEAEVLSFRCQNATKLLGAYDRAIYAANKVGYIHDAALGYELAGTSMLALGEEGRAFQYMNQSRDLWREYGAHAKVKHLLEQHGRKLDVTAIETTETVNDVTILASADFSEPRKSLDLDLLSGRIMKTEIQTRASEAARKGSSETVRDKQDEVSILSDPSSDCMNGTAASTINWTRQ